MSEKKAGKTTFYWWLAGLLVSIIILREEANANPVICAAIIQLTISLGSKLLTGSAATWLGDDLIKILGDLLTVLIALEVLQNITSYLRRHVVQIELVLVTALTAVARKVIVLPSGAENKPQLLVGLGIAVVSLSAAYWLVKRANATPTRTGLGREAASKPDNHS